MTTFYPSLRYGDARAAIEWLEEAFGFEREMVVDGDADAVAHAQLKFGDGIIMLGSERDDGWGHHAGQSWVYVAVEGDIDAHCERARDAGAEIVREPTDQDYGSRDYSARDLEGNLWSFGTYRP
ncbi:MAG: VOC family protein [Solirubrobacterales bacterium]